MKVDVQPWLLCGIAVMLGIDARDVVDVNGPLNGLIAAILLPLLSYVLIRIAVRNTYARLAIIAVGLVISLAGIVWPHPPVTSMISYFLTTLLFWMMYFSDESEPKPPSPNQPA